VVGERKKEKKRKPRDLPSRLPPSHFHWFLLPSKEKVQMAARNGERKKRGGKRGKKGKKRE